MHELYKITRDPVAKSVCIDVADAVLHYAARDRFGMLAHDDLNFTKFAIPDTAYWATRSNAIAASLSTDPQVAAVYWKQAVFQLEAGLRNFIDTEKQIVRTGLFDGVPSKTYWCRSQGWLLWAIGGLLRYLPQDHPEFARTAFAMQTIATGLQKYQGICVGTPVENFYISIICNNSESLGGNQKHLRAPSARVFFAL